MDKKKQTDAEVRYGDSIDLPHRASQKRKTMDRIARAAQFSAFAALTGYDAYIAEEGRFTSGRVELDEEEKAHIDAVLRSLCEGEAKGKTATVTYFVGDSRKKGGSYASVTDAVSFIDRDACAVVMRSGETIPVECIVSVVPTDEP